MLPYHRVSRAAGGSWHALITGPDGAVIVEDGADDVVHGYSVQKIAVAAAVLASVPPDRLVPLEKHLILGGSGLYHLQGVWGDQVTVAGMLTAMLLVSDNTAVRLCGLLVPGPEINAFLAGAGFTRTRVEPGADPHRFLLGTTTPRETHTLLTRLAGGTLLPPAATGFLLRVLRAAGGYTDGVRRNMSSSERERIATKHGADFDRLGAARHEAGIVYGPDGRPGFTYAMFADRLGEKGNYGATHPAVEAHAVLGRVMIDNLT